MTARRRLSRADRLLRRRDFSSVTRRGCRAAGRYFVLLVAASTRADGCNWPRIGVTVSGRVGGSVVRNRVKRRIREWFRASQALPPGVDVVVIARRSAAPLTGREVAGSLEELVGRMRCESRS